MRDGILATGDDRHRALRRCAGVVGNATKDAAAWITVSGNSSLGSSFSL